MIWLITYYITNLNKSRNLQILKQVKELNNLLLANNITPIFLKVFLIFGLEFIKIFRKE